MLATSIAQPRRLDQQGHIAGKSNKDSQEYTIEVLVAGTVALRGGGAGCGWRRAGGHSRW